MSSRRRLRSCKGPHSIVLDQVFVLLVYAIRYTIEYEMVVKLRRVCLDAQFASGSEDVRNDI